MAANYQTFTITLTAGAGTKYIYAQVTSGSHVAHSMDEIDYITITDPYIQKFSKTSRYTSGWDLYGYNVCNPSKMSVVTLNPGLDTIPANPLSDTVYVLNSGDYRTSRVIYFGYLNGNCSALIGSGRVTLYSTVYLDRTVYTL